MFKLVISDDEGQTTVVPLLRDQITIGRQAGNTIRLTERNVSRNHARLLKRNGAYIVEDLGSYNGVTVNGEQVDVTATLSSGDQVGIGDYGLALQLEAAASAPPVEAPATDSGPPPRLVVLSEPAAGAEFSLGKSIMRIGRDERLDIWINHKSISHEHAEVQLANGVVTVFDLDSANGVRVNGIDTKRAILESGDVLELGAVRFRFLRPQGTHSLAEMPTEMPAARTPSEHKSLFVLAVLGLLALAATGAILVTMPDTPLADESLEPTGGALAVEASAPPEIEQRAEASPPKTRIEPPPVQVEPDPVDEPKEWEGLLARARSKLASGRIDAAYRIANELPEDSVLREAPEFGEIRYRYAQAHIAAGNDALADKDIELAKREAKLVLALGGITSKQRRDAKRLLNQSRKPAPPREAPVSSADALAQAHRCVASGDNACVIRALEGGQARTPGALALLIETYRAMDDLPAARRHMRAFAERYPDNPRTSRYRQMLVAD